MHDLINNGSKSNDGLEYVNDFIKPNYSTYQDTNNVCNYIKNYISSTDSDSITASTINSHNRTIDIEDIVTYKDLADEGDINKMYKLIFESFCKIYPEKESEYKMLLKLYFMDYRRTVIAIETQNFKQMAENGFTL